MSKNKFRTEEGFSYILPLIIFAALLGIGGISNINVTEQFPKPIASQNVLGEDEEVKEAEKKAEEQQKSALEAQQEAQKKQEEQTNQSQKSQQEAIKKQSELEKENLKSNKSGSSNITKTTKETISPTGVKSKTQTEGKKSETEIETADGQKIKTKVEDDGTTKIEVEHGQLKLKYVLENGQIKLKAENERGQEVELDDDELNEVEDEIEDELEDQGIKIATGSGKPTVVKNNFAAQTDFPLSIDVGTNQLIVTTPAGQKVVTVLPDQAVQNLLATNIINKIDRGTSDSAQTPDLENLDGVVKLEIKNNSVVYKIKGTKNHNLLGFIPLNTATTVFVSADTGQPVAKEQSLLANIIDTLSF